MTSAQKKEKKFSALNFNEFPCEVERDKYLSRHHCYVYVIHSFIHCHSYLSVVCIRFFLQQYKAKANPYTYKCIWLELDFLSFHTVFETRNRNIIEKQIKIRLIVFIFCVLYTRQIQFCPFWIQARGPKKDVSIECKLMMLLLMLLLLHVSRVDNQNWFETSIASSAWFSATRFTHTLG